MVTFFDVRSNEIAGTLDTAMLPRNLKRLHIYSNEFSGTIDWEALPPNLAYLGLSNNGFEGNVNLNVLPSSLEILWLEKNNFISKFYQESREKLWIFMENHMCYCCC